MQDASPAGHSARDPVCGMTVDLRFTTHRLTHGQQEYFFCCEGCLKKFEEDPRRYLEESSRPPSTASSHSPSSAQVEHTCPMHPEVIQDGPGDCPECGMALEPSRPDVETKYVCPMHPEVVAPQPGNCPKCGMALEPRRVSAKAEDSGELRDMRRRFWVSLIFAGPLLLLGMSEMLGPRMGIDFLSGSFGQWLQWVLATPVVLWGGLPFFQRGRRSLVTGHLNMFTLIALGTGIAYLYSLAALLLPGIFPDSLRSPEGLVGVYFEAASTIVVLVLLGQVLELKARGRTGQAIRALLELTPPRARRIDPQGHEEDVAVENVVVGDLLRLRTGERIAVDGAVERGMGAVDESMISGEPIPIEKSTGDALIGGTLLETGALVMKATRVGQETVLARIVEMVSQAQRSQAPIQRTADAVAAYFVPAVVISALVTFLVWLFWGPSPSYAWINAVAVLIIACPCALGLATPMSIMVGTGLGARNGILFRNAEALERLEHIDTLIFDKTGTLTEGRPRLSDISPAAQHDPDEVLTIAAALERSSQHPLAAAILAAAQERDLPIDEAEDFQTIIGRGVKGTLGGRPAALGNEALMAEMGADPAPWAARADELRQRGATVVFLMHDGLIKGLLGIADSVKESSRQAVQDLRSQGLQMIMLTGDNALSAQAVAQQVGLDQVEAGLLPDEKAKTVARLQAQGHRVAMAGDGINDAPSLAQAEVGIAMSTGADVAIESAGVTLMKGDLSALVRAIRLSRAVMSNVRQNLFFAFIYNALGVPLAAGILYPWTGILLSPMLAAAAMSFSSVSVIANALRLMRVRL